ncbi:hypothetical protein CU669_19810 [Paramagnetospirillum kuznetsovii]|uniref:Uncharacterized protein n=1 Tax=Paramagnetospirillum kuznetsovii TaxID=2053833 RepID=A0A364NSW5_9PROT|nr:hypothetical protein [Paramagnetospirillum kuznetsovii]RAU20181.1 hypothetical protein CU669_19810 [Paramagnetospirillum kuznetsovii]
MTGTDSVRQELEKAVSLVGTARRLLATGTMVDLAALEGKVKGICRSVIDLGLEDGKTLRSDMEALIADLDLLAADIRYRYDPEPDRQALDSEH